MRQLQDGTQAASPTRCRDAVRLLPRRERARPLPRGSDDEEAAPWTRNRSFSVAVEGRATEAMNDGHDQDDDEAIVFGGEDVPLRQIVAITCKDREQWIPSAPKAAEE